MLGLGVEASGVKGVEAVVESTYSPRMAVRQALQRACCGLHSFLGGSRKGAPM